MFTLDEKVSRPMQVPDAPAQALLEILRCGCIRGALAAKPPHRSRKLDSPRHVDFRTSMFLVPILMTTL
jgi:hypothetical protein